MSRLNGCLTMRWDGECSAHLGSAEQLDLAGSVGLLHAGRQDAAAGPGRLAAPLAGTEERETHALPRPLLPRRSRRADGRPERRIE